MKKFIMLYIVFACAILLIISFGKVNGIDGERLVNSVVIKTKQVIKSLRD